MYGLFVLRFSHKYCDVFLETHCAFELTFVWDWACPASLEPPCHWWEGTVAPVCWLGGPAEWVFQWRSGDELSQLSLLLPRLGESGAAAVSGWLLWRAVDLYLLFSVLFFCSPDSFFCPGSHSVYGFISGGLINYQYSLHTSLMRINNGCVYT